MAIILLSFSYCNFEVSTLSTYHVGDPKNLLPIRHGSWGILTTRGFLIEREAGSTSPNLAVPRFYRCMCMSMCALLSLVLRSMIGIFIGILNGLILEASSISSRPKLLISLTWQVSISDKNCLLARIPLAASPDQLFDLFHCCSCRWRSSSSDKCTVYDLGNFTLNCNFWI